MRGLRGRNQGFALYSPEERRRRDASPWTFVQGVLAPLQFVVFLVSLALVLWYLATGEGLFAATVSVLAKTLDNLSEGQMKQMKQYVQVYKQLLKVVSF